MLPVLPLNIALMTNKLLHDEEEKQELSDKELLGLARVFMSAGGEEPGAMIAFTAYLLLVTPTAYEAARTEVLDAFKNIDEMNNRSLTQLPYLNAVISEALRVHHSGAQRFSRRTVQEEVIAGYTVPPGVSCHVLRVIIS